MNKRNAKKKKRLQLSWNERDVAIYKEKTRMAEGTDWPRGMFRPIKSTVCAIYILKRDEKSLTAMYSWRRFICTCMNMHLAALPPIYVSGTSRTNFGNNRTGSDRMSTGCPPGILDTVLPPLQPEALPAEPILLAPLFFSPRFRFPSIRPPKLVILFRFFSSLPSSFFSLFSSFFLLLLRLFSVYSGVSREHIVRNNVQFSYFIGPYRDNKI